MKTLIISKFLVFKSFHFKDPQNMSKQIFQEKQTLKNDFENPSGLPSSLPLWLPPSRASLADLAHLKSAD